MLELRPTCEHCNKAFTPEAADVMICTFECTFCKNCVNTLLVDICPNCGGNFTERPIRPKHLLKKYPASKIVIHKPVDIAAHLKIHKSQK